MILALSYQFIVANARLAGSAAIVQADS